MQFRLGGSDRLSFILFGALTALTAITPLGKESTHPLVFLFYRTILLFIVLAAGRGVLQRSRERGAALVCPYFLGIVGLYILLGVTSVLTEKGSHFEGGYVFYERALFIAAAVALAAFSRFNEPRWKRAVLVMVPTIGVLHLTAALAANWGSRPLTGPFVNPNYFASYLLPGLAAAMTLSALGRGWGTKIAALSVTAFLGYGILETSSRAAVLAIFLMMGVAVLRWRRNLPGVAAIAAVIAAVYLLSPQTAVVKKFLDRGQGDPYNYARPMIWKGALQIAGTHPFLGVGPGRYAYASKRFTPAIEGTIARYRKFPNMAHSEYLQTLAENGAPAAAILVLLLLYLGYRMWAQQPAGLNGDETLRPVQEAALLAAAGVGAHALVDNNWTVPVLASTLAIVSQADLLPWRTASQTSAWIERFRLTPTWRVLAFVLVGGILTHSTLIPAAGLYFNEEGHRAYTAQDFERAELMHALAVGIVPDHPVFLDNLGMVYLDEFTRTHKPEHLEYARTAFEASVAANPVFDIPLGHLETVFIQSVTGIIEMDRPIHEKIVLTDRRLLDVNPFNPFIRRNLAEALYNLGDKAAAERELQSAIEIEPNYVPGYLRLADWRNEAGARKEAEALTAHAIEIVTRYRDKRVDPFEALLLGRPEPAR